MSSDLERPLDGLQRLLASHVYACATADYVVLLDTRRNAFLGVSHEHLRGALPAELAQEMNKLGMLAKEAAAGSRTAHAPPVESLYEGFIPFNEPIFFSFMLNVARSFINARLAVSSGNVERRVRVSTERARKHKECGHASLSDIRRLVAAYAHCRAWLTSTAGKCLLDSLALQDFLSRYGIASSLVIGVRTTPFGAHAWVQRSGFVLNDQCEIVKAYGCIYASVET